MRILGWILFICNIAGLVFCVYRLQLEPKIFYVLAVGFFLAQTVYIAQTFKIIRKLRIAQKILSGATKRAGLEMSKIISGKKNP